MLVPVKFLIVGMELASDVIIKDIVLIESGSILTEKDIKNLSIKGIESVDIKLNDKFTSFNKYTNMMIGNVLSSNNIDDIVLLAKLLCDYINSSKILLFDLYSYIDNYYSHIVNSIEIGLIILKKYNEISEKKNRIDDYSFVLSSLLQDVGRNARNELVLKNIKSKYELEIKDLINIYPNIKEDIFLKYDGKYHPVYSYFIAKNYNLSDTICKSILLHHEKQMGSTSLLGMPILDSTESDEVKKIASILKLADLFDILVRENMEENKLLPFNNLSTYIDKMVASSFVDAKLTNILKSVIPIYQIGDKVKTDDGVIGTVIETDALDYNRPTIIDDNKVVIEYNNIWHYRD